MRRLRFVAAILVGLAVIGAMFVLAAWREARADPVVRRATLLLPHWPAGAPPVTLALLSDIHMESAAMNGARLERIVAQTDALHPDIVVLAGDFVEASGIGEATRAAPLLNAALARLTAPMGIYAVLGNHDHWTDPALIARLLIADNIHVLENQAVEVGPLAIGGIDDPSTRHARVRPTLAAMKRLPGARVLIAHSPQVVRKLPPAVTLLLAGHTHCGQIVLPLVGPPIDVVAPRYRCGLIRDPRRVTVVTAGVGTSNLPLRWGAPPDLWLLTLGPAPRS